MSVERLPASFRDPSGFLFSYDHQLYRQVNLVYRDDYDYLMASGLYDALVRSRLLIPHQEVDVAPTTDLGQPYKIIKPARIPFVSYPYEWCFSQLKNAALTMLQIQTRALGFGMTLKDSSAYNIQFKDGKPILIDTLSFERYREGEAWVGYRQFCQHFLAPLLLAVYRDMRLTQLLRVHIDGIPLDLTRALLPARTVFRPSVFAHIHLHARSQKYFSNKNVSSSKVSRLALLGILESLEATVKKMTWNGNSTGWANYYDETNYSKVALEHKKRLVSKWLDRIDPGTVWDLGANTGLFSSIASSRGNNTISFDLDPWVVEKNYLDNLTRQETRILPLLLDLTNPSPGIGWRNKERNSLIERGPADTVLALAFIHHLAISNNLPLDRIAAFLGDICHNLIIEFIPKTDSQVKRLLSSREDIFPHYTQENFEHEFKSYFTLKTSVPVKDTHRTLYWMTGQSVYR